MARQVVVCSHQMCIVALIATACGGPSAVDGRGRGEGALDPRSVPIGGSLSGVSSAQDTDQDGITDLVEGTADGDGDGIPAHLDADERSSVGAQAGADNWGADAGPDGVSTMGAGTDDWAQGPCTPGPTPGSSVLLIGDSYMATGNRAFGSTLQDLARSASALLPGDRYTDRSVGGSDMGSDQGVDSARPSIPAQYLQENNADGHVRTVVMTGGGNDVLAGQRSCILRQAPPESQICVDTIDRVLARAEALLAQMAADGVRDVVYFFYPHLPGGLASGKKELVRQTMDYVLEREDGVTLPEVCARAPLRCVFVDTRGLFPAEHDQFQDGIHPTVPNVQKIAGEVWAAMQQHCIAQ